MEAMLSIHSVSVGVLLCAGLNATVAAGAQGAGDVGARQYAVTCAGCHAGDGSGSVKGPAIARQAVTIARSDDELMRIVRDGVPGKGMPGVKALGDERIAAVVKYLRTMQANAVGAGLTIQTSPATSTAEAARTTASAVSGNPDGRVVAARVGGVSVDVTAAELNQKEVREDWVSYNGDYSGRRYSAMNEVTPENARRVKLKWKTALPGAGVMEMTPVVVGGVMFATRSNDAWALDAATGKVLWHHARAVTEGLIDDASGHINRGVAVLGTRVYMETDDAHLLCLDARTGAVVWDVAYATDNRNYGATSAPLIVKDKVLVGTSGGDDGVRGFIAAYDAATGKEAWRFWTIPAPGEKGAESWPGDLYLHGGGTTWMPGSYDAELNTIYWGTGNPGPDFDGSVRPGDDLYTSSLIALDPDTGRLKWFFQFSPHDLYDYDAVQTPVLVDANFAGAPQKLVVTANRNGFLYLLDRVTGEYLASRQFSASQNWAVKLDDKGRPVSAGLVPDEKGVTVCPGYSGATNWYSPSYDPATKLFYFRSLESCSLFKAQTDKFEEGTAFYATGAERAPGNRPEASYLNAFDVEKLAPAWRNTLVGDGPAVAGAMSAAGGVVAFGNDAKELEFDDARTGKKLAGLPLSAPMHASPMSYGVAGRQYFAAAAGDEVFAFALP
jgi:alcohol dehydrogenase (cytochrome c)